MHIRVPFTLIVLGLILEIGAAHADSGRKIPFEIERNKVILEVKINGSRPLRIILDSGMPGQGLALFKKELGEELNLVGSALYRIEGAGQGRESTAIKVDSQMLSIAGVEFSNQPVMILQNDTMRGFPTDGVMGNTIFGPYAVRFDFENKCITLLETGSFHPDSSWEAMAMTFNEHGIPFIEASVSIGGEEDIPLNVYIDSASGEALELLVKPEQKFVLPENLEMRYLGRGLSGDITGQFGNSVEI